MRNESFLRSATFQRISPACFSTGPGCIRHGALATRFPLGTYPLARQLQRQEPCGLVGNSIYHFSRQTGYIGAFRKANWQCHGNPSSTPVRGGLWQPRGKRVQLTRSMSSRSLLLFARCTSQPHLTCFIGNESSVGLQGWTGGPVISMCILQSGTNNLTSIL